MRSTSSATFDLSDCKKPLKYPLLAVSFDHPFLTLPKLTQILERALDERIHHRKLPDGGFEVGVRDVPSWGLVIVTLLTYTNHTPSLRVIRPSEGDGIDVFDALVIDSVYPWGE